MWQVKKITRFIEVEMECINPPLMKEFHSVINSERIKDLISRYVPPFCFLLF